MRDIQRIQRWEREVGLPPSESPRTTWPSRASTPIPDIRPVSPLSAEDIPPDFVESGHGSNSDVDGGVDDTFRTAPDEDLLAQLCREGGVNLFNFLLEKAVDPTDPKPIREWTYRDIQRLPPVQ